MTDDAPLVRVELPAVRPPGVAETAQAGEAPASAPDEIGAPVFLDGVALVTIDRPRALNSLSSAALAELAAVCARLDADPACRVAVFTGAGTRAFATGADIEEFAAESAVGLAASGRFDDWGAIARMRIPSIAAVRGYALGGGLEIAMSCDMLILGDDAKVGQPEIRLGLIPGAGGTQRLARAIGRARATELILTGRWIDAAEADRLGLATRVVPAAETVTTALDLATSIAAMPPLAVRAAVEAVRMAEEVPLTVGIRHERQLFYMLFGTEDTAEGLAAFLEKRDPTWRGR